MCIVLSQMTHYNASLSAGTQITRTLCRTSAIRVQLASRAPQRSYDALKATISGSSLLPPVSADVKSLPTLLSAFKDATLVVSLVGIMHGTPQDFEDIQWKGAANVAKAAFESGAKLVHLSAIGANPESAIPYVRTKGLGETAVLQSHPTATIVRPSLVFGPDDDFFNVCDSAWRASLRAALKQSRDLLACPSSCLSCQSSGEVHRSSSLFLWMILHALSTLSQEMILRREQFKAKSLKLVVRKVSLSPR